MSSKHIGYYVYGDDDEFIVHIEVEGEPQTAYTHQTIKDPEYATYGTRKFKVLKIEDNQGQEITTLSIKKCNRMEEYSNRGLSEKNMPINMEKGTNHKLKHCRLSYYISYERAQHLLYGCSSSSYVGIVKEWYPSGRLKREGFVNGNGRQQGIERIYDEWSDNLVGENAYIDGKLQYEKEFDDAGTLIDYTPYMDDDLHGEEVIYNHLGLPKRTVVWERGHLLSETIFEDNLTDEDEPKPPPKKIVKKTIKKSTDDDGDE